MGGFVAERRVSVPLLAIAPVRSCPSRVHSAASAHRGADRGDTHARHLEGAPHDMRYGSQSQRDPDQRVLPIGTALYSQAFCPRGEPRRP